MSLGSFFLFIFVIYLFFVIGRSILTNYHSNKDLEIQADKITILENELTDMRYRINYYQTSSFKEKEAREKLGYKAPGENVIALPMDKEEEKVADKELGDVILKTPNYKLWWRYFFE